MARTPDIAVRIRADGIAAARASIKAFTASATKSFGLMEKGASQALSTLRLLAKPIQITVGGAAAIARTTALVGTLAAALAGIEGGKIVDAGNTMAGITSGLQVAAASAYDTQKALRDIAEKAEVDRLADQMTDLEAKTYRAGYAAKKAAQDQAEAARRAIDLRKEEFALSRMSGAEQAAYRQRDATVAADMELANLRATTKKYGVDLESTAGAYAAFANATKGSAAQGRITLQTMQAMVIASKGLNLNADQTKRAMQTAAQIAAKGKLSQEEVLQLAEAGIPAQAILARGLGVTGAKLGEMQAKGIDAATALDALSRQLTTEFRGAAEQAAQRPAAAFARLRNAIFEARVQAADGGISRGLGVISDSATRLIETLTASGAFKRFGESIGQALEAVPGLLQRVAVQYEILRVYAGRWIDQMRIALGIDTTGWADRTAAGFGWLRETLLQLAFDIPGVIYALRQAFAGNDENVAERYQWVLPLRDFIQNQLMPLLAQVPGLVEKWLPIFIGVAGTIVSIMGGIRDTMVAVFGEEGANKIAAFLIIGRFTGILSSIAGAMGFVGTAVRGVVATFNLLRAASLIMFTPPGGLIIAAIAAVAALAYVVYQNWDSIKAFLIGIWDAVSAAATGFIDGLRAAWNGVTDFLTKPFELAKKAISFILDALAAAVENSPAGLIFKGGKFLIEQGAKAAGFATGGMIRGPGTGTSDSIPIWASNGEGMVNSAATRHYGGERFINSLNDMSFSPYAAPADVIEVSSGGTGRPMSFVMPGVGAASGRVDDDFANGMKRVFDKATAGRARQAKPRGHR